MTGIPLYPNTGPQWLPSINPGTGYAGTTNSQIPSYVYGPVPEGEPATWDSAWAATRPNYQQEPNISQPMTDGGRTTQYPTQASEDAETLAMLERARILQENRGWIPGSGPIEAQRPVLDGPVEAQRPFDAGFYGDPLVAQKPGYASSAIGQKTKLNPGQLAREWYKWDQGQKSDYKKSDLEADINNMNAFQQEAFSGMLTQQYNNALETGKIKPGTLANQQGKAYNGMTAVQKAQMYANNGNPAYGATAPSYFNPTGQRNREGGAGGPLGPMGEVSIYQGKPADLGWGTSSAYDPNTGLSKWSSSGLTNGEFYYDNLYAGQRSAESQRKAAQAASRAAYDQKRSMAAQRQDFRNELVDSLVAGGRDKSMARMDAKALSDDELIQRVQAARDQAAQAAANTNDPTLQQMLDQFSSPNYQPAGGGVGGTQTPIGGDMNTGQQTPILDVNQEYQQVVNQQQLAQQQWDQQQRLNAEFQQAQDAANAANEARYQDIVAGYQDNMANIEGYLTDQGRQASTDINRNYQRSLGANEQDLINRGLGNTTVRSSTMRGIEEDRARNQLNLQEQIDRQRLQYQTQAQNDLLGFMERRNDQGPDYNQLIGLQEGLGSAAGGYTGGNYQTGEPSGFTGNPAAPPMSNGYQPTGGMFGSTSPYEPIFGGDQTQGPGQNQSSSGQYPQPTYSGSTYQGIPTQEAINQGIPGAGMKLGPNETLDSNKQGGSNYTLVEDHFQRQPYELQPMGDQGQGMSQPVYGSGSPYNNPVSQGGYVSPTSTGTARTPAQQQAIDKANAAAYRAMGRNPDGSMPGAAPIGQPVYGSNGQLPGSGAINQRSDGSSTATAAPGYVRPTSSPTLAQSRQNVQNRFANQAANQWSRMPSYN